MSPLWEMPSYRCFTYGQVEGLLFALGDLFHFFKSLVHGKWLNISHADALTEPFDHLHRALGVQLLDFSAELFAVRLQVKILLSVLPEKQIKCHNCWNERFNYNKYLNLFFCIARSVFSSSVLLWSCLRLSSLKISSGSSSVSRSPTLVPSWTPDGSWPPASGSVGNDSKNSSLPPMECSRTDCLGTLASAGALKIKIHIRIGPNETIHDFTLV